MKRTPLSKHGRIWSWKDKNCPLFDPIINIFLKIVTFRRLQSINALSWIWESKRNIRHFPYLYTLYFILQARILEWVAISFSRGSSQTRNQTWASCIAGRFFTNWTTRDAHLYTVPVGNQTKDKSLKRVL